VASFRVRRTLAITCEAHIDDARAIVEHPQVQRFDRFIALLCSRSALRLGIILPDAAGERVPHPG
jgi:hypothetical protein